MKISIYLHWNYSWTNLILKASTARLQNCLQLAHAAWTWSCSFLKLKCHFLLLLSLLVCECCFCFVSVKKKNKLSFFIHNSNCYYLPAVLIRNPKPAVKKTFFTLTGAGRRKNVNVRIFRSGSTAALPFSSLFHFPSCRDRGRSQSPVLAVHPPN